MHRLASAIWRFYLRPSRKGAMMTFGQIKIAYLYLLLCLFFAALFWFSLIVAEPGEIETFWIIAGWSLVGGSIFGVTMFAAAIYGYHRRDQIDTSDETPVDLSQAVCGGILAVILAPILRWLFDYLGG